MTKIKVFFADCRIVK